MSTPTSPQRRQNRSVSNASSGDRTIRPRRQSSSSTGSESQADDSTSVGGIADPEDDLASTAEPSQSTHPSAWSAPGWGDVELQGEAPPPLWRQASSRGYKEGEDSEDGPSDYWRRPSPTLVPDLAPASPTDPWLRSAQADVPTPDAEDDDGGGDADTIEYSKRLEQVLSLADQPPSPSPTRRRDRNRAAFLTGAADEEEEDTWGESESPLRNGKGYEDAVRDVLQDSASVADTLEGKDEDEFGTTPLRSRVSLPSPKPDADPHRRMCLSELPRQHHCPPPFRKECNRQCVPARVVLLDPTSVRCTVAVHADADRPFRF